MLELEINCPKSNPLDFKKREQKNGSHKMRALGRKIEEVGRGYL